MDNCSLFTTSGLIFAAIVNNTLFTTRILYIRLLYLMRLFQYSNCGGYGLGAIGGLGGGLGGGVGGGVGGGFSNYFSGGYRFAFICSLMNFIL